MPELDVAAPDEHGQHQRLELHRQLADEQHTFLREPIAQRAADRRQEEDRRELQRADDAELEGRLRDLEHQPRLRHALHPRADLRDQLAGPEEPEVAVPESAETCSARRMLACSSGAIWSPGHRS